MKKFFVALMLTAAFFLASVGGATVVAPEKAAPTVKTDNTVKTTVSKPAKKVKKSKKAKPASKPAAPTGVKAVDNTVKK